MNILFEEWGPSYLTFDEVSDDSNNLMNTYLSVHAQKTNEVMKLLTVFSAFFLPLTFIGLMAILSIVIFLWFRKKKIL
jgi:magnesium transporter